MAGQAAAGSGVAPRDIGFVLGIVKAYTTRVGEGPFPTELNDATGDRLGERGLEFGTVTGRKRRCGWFDAVLVRQTVITGGIDGIALTKLDVLDGFKEIKICTGYKLGRPRARLSARRRQRAGARRARLRNAGRLERIHARRAQLEEASRQRHQICAPHRGTDRRQGGALSTSPERDDTILVRDPFVGRLDYASSFLRPSIARVSTHRGGSHGLD